MVFGHGLRALWRNSQIWDLIPKGVIERRSDLRPIALSAVANGKGTLEGVLRKGVAPLPRCVASSVADLHNPSSKRNVESSSQLVQGVLSPLLLPTHHSVMMDRTKETGQDQNRSESRFSVDPHPSGAQDNLSPVARARAIVAKRIAKAATKKNLSQEHIGGHADEHGNGARRSGEGAADPFWLRNQFAEQLRLEEQQAEEVRLVAKELENWRGRLVASKEAAEGRRGERQAFAELLSTQDATSDEDIRRALHAINDTTEQLTVQASKEFFTSTARYAIHPALDQDRHRLEGILGSPLYKALQITTPKDTFAGLLLQYSWQACITNAASNMLQAFSLASPGMPETSEVDQAFKKASSTAEADGRFLRSLYLHIVTTVRILRVPTCVWTLAVDDTQLPPPKYGNEARRAPQAY